MSPLPEDLQCEILQLSSRTICTGFRSCRAIKCRALHLRWPAEAAGPHTPIVLRQLLTQLPQLESLNATSCPAHCLQAVALPCLTSLDLGNSYFLVSLDPLSACTSLTSLNLCSCEGIGSVQALGPCKRLSALDLSYCHALVDEQSLREFTALTSLDSSVCNQLTDIS